MWLLYWILGSCSYHIGIPCLLTIDGSQHYMMCISMCWVLCKLNNRLSSSRMQVYMHQNMYHFHICILRLHQLNQQNMFGIELMIGKWCNQINYIEYKWMSKYQENNWHSHCSLYTCYLVGILSILLSKVSINQQQDQVHCLNYSLHTSCKHYQSQHNHPGKRNIHIVKPPEKHQQVHRWSYKNNPYSQQFWKYKSCRQSTLCHHSSQSSINKPWNCKEYDDHCLNHIECNPMMMCMRDKNSCKLDSWKFPNSSICRRGRRLSVLQLQIRGSEVMWLIFCSQGFQWIIKLLNLLLHSINSTLIHILYGFYYVKVRLKNAQTTLQQPLSSADPTVLTKIDNSSYSNGEIQNVTFKLYKGNQLIDQTKIPVPVVQLNGYYSISRVFLNFNVSLAENMNVNQFVIKVTQPCGKNSIIDMIYDEKSYDAHFGEEFLGQHLIKVGHFVEEFTKKENKYFKETAQISDKFGLKFDVFVQKTRFMLQKYVRSMRDSIKQNGEIKAVRTNRSESDKGTRELSPQSQRSQKVHSKGQNIFISPFRSLEKNRKLIIRNSVKKNNTTIIQQDSGIYSKSFNNKNDSTENKKIKLLKPDEKIKNAQSQYPNASQIQDDPLKDLEESDHNQDNFDRPSYGSTEQIEIKMVKSQTSSKKTKKKLVKKVLTPRKVEDNIKQEKIHTEPGLTASQQKKLNKDLSMKIFSIVFAVFAFIVLLKVMSPSKKT